MHFLSATLYAISANLDCLTIAMAYGIKKTKFPFHYNFMIAAISSLGTYISMMIGNIIIDYISIKTANQIGSLLLTGVGIWIISKHFIVLKTNQNENNHTKASPHHTIISFKEVVVLAIALTFNNIALGISASITGMPIFWTTALTFVCSISFFEIGQRLGNSFFSNIFGKYASLITGILLIILGMYELYI